jgi:hypothetical protein
MAQTCQFVKLSQTARTQISKNLSKRKTLKNLPEPVEIETFFKKLKMFQVAT